ncbi:MAG: lysophospholipid acyltransferase family protein [Myxococcota bacterium]
MDETIPRSTRRRLAVQKTVARLLSPLSLLAAHVAMRFGLDLRLADAHEARRTYRRLVREDGPLLVCANHLTMVDSALVAWALGSPGWYFAHFRALPWNVPEERNFASTWPRRVLAYVYKCVPVRRGGDRADVADTLQRFTHLLASGESGLLFPEGGRSRSGRVEVERAAYGVGRIVKSLPGCRVLCVYLRGERQEGYTSLPARGDRLHVATATIEPKTDHRGLRGSRDVARQITAKLAEMEADHFAAGAAS